MLEGPARQLGNIIQLIGTATIVHLNVDEVYNSGNKNPFWENTSRVSKSTHEWHYKTHQSINGIYFWNWSSGNITEKSIVW